MLGRKLAQYEIVEKLGAGGMGEVYKATDTRLGRSVAIKVLAGHLAARPELRARFEREARAISSLSHPNICTLHDVGHADGVDYLVMEHLEGETLAQRLARERVPLAQALRVGAEIAGALDAAHRRGIIHRDLKPGNVMLTRSGVKLLDFGLAKLVEPPGGDALTAGPTEPRRDEPLTERGTILGTFRYMAPEQLEGKDADPRTDLFALGALLYEMAAGRPAFEGKSRASLIAAILEREPAPLSSIEPLAPPALDRTIRRCLAKDPEARWQSAADVASELSWIAEEGSRAGTPAAVASRQRARERVLGAVAASLAVLALGLGGAQLARRPAPVIRAAILPPEGRVFDLDGYEPGPAVLSPDGSMAAFVTEGLTDSLWIRALEAEAPRFVAAGVALAYPFWSPDSRAIGFFADGALRRVDAAGAPPMSLCPAENGKGGAWSEDGVVVFAPDAATPLYRVAATGGEAVQVTQLDSSRAERSHRHPSFLPDGRRFLFFARDNTSPGARGHVMVGSLDGEPTRRVLASESQALYASGRLLFLRQATLLAQPFDLRRLAPRGEPAPVANGVDLLAGAAYAAFSVSRRGTLLFHPDRPEQLTDLVWYGRDGAPQDTLGEPFGEPSTYAGLRFAPDGETLALEIRDLDTGRSDLWIHDLGRDVRSRFTFDPGDETCPVWSPDGAWLYFGGNGRGHFDLYRKLVLGGDVEEPILESGVDKLPMSVTPDGRALVFAQGDDLWTLPLETGAAPSLLLKAAQGGQVSPDGRWMTYVSVESGRPEAYLTRFPQLGRKWQVSPKGSIAVAWWKEPELVYIDLDGAAWHVDAVLGPAGDVAIGRPRLSLAAPNRVVDGAVHPDGKRSLLAVRHGEPTSEPAALVLNWPGALRR
jgi:hypothetical protein